MKIEWAYQLWDDGKSENYCRRYRKDYGKVIVAEVELRLGRRVFQIGVELKPKSKSKGLSNEQREAPTGDGRVL